MDKIVSLGSRKRPLCSDPSLNEILPVEDAAWELGDIGGAIQATVSSPFTEPQSAFGRLCQGSLLISRMLEHPKRLKDACDLNYGGRFDYSEVKSLIGSAHELNASIQAEMAARPSSYFSLLPAQCLAYSAVLKALDLFCPATAEVSADASSMEMGMEMNAWAAAAAAAAEGNNVPSLQQTAACIENRKTAASEQVRDLAQDLLSIIGSCDDGEMVKTSPFVLDAVYSAATVSLVAWKAGAAAGDPSAEASLATTRELLVRLSGRWRLGVEYLKALEQHGVSAMLGQNFAGSGSSTNSSSGQAGISLVPFPSSAVDVMPAIVC